MIEINMQQIVTQPDLPIVSFVILSKSACNMLHVRKLKYEKYI